MFVAEPTVEAGWAWGWSNAVRVIERGVEAGMENLLQGFGERRYGGSV